MDNLILWYRFEAFVVTLPFSNSLTLWLDRSFFISKTSKMVESVALSTQLPKLKCLRISDIFFFFSIKKSNNRCCLAMKSISPNNFFSRLVILVSYNELLSQYQRMRRQFFFSEIGYFRLYNHRDPKESQKQGCLGSWWNVSRQIWALGPHCPLLGGIQFGPRYRGRTVCVSCLDLHWWFCTDVLATLVTLLHHNVKSTWRAV